MSIEAVINLQISSVDLVNDQTQITFTFIKPEGLIGGYQLYISSTGIEYTYVKTRIDATHPQDDADNTYDLNGITYFVYTIDNPTLDGRFLFFKLKSISTSMEYSDFSDPVTVYTYPSPVENMFILYDGYEVVLTWSPIDYTSKRNSTFTNYNIYRSEPTRLNNVTIDTNNNLMHSSFVKGKYVWVIDIFKRSQWFGQITSTGMFPLSTTLLSEYSDVYANDTVSINNLAVFVDNTSPVLIGTSTTGIYVDMLFEPNHFYIYSIHTAALGNRVSRYTKYMCRTIEVDQTYPYLRSAENSDDDILHNKYWRELRNTLIDDNYYNKSAFAIPYMYNKSYNFKGHLGVSNCKVDIFINDIYNFTTTTGIYGEFEINHIFSKDPTIIKMQARDQYNIKFSRESAPITIIPITIYTLFSIFGMEYDKIYSEYSGLIQDVSIDTCRYSFFEDKYSPFINMYKHGDEDAEDFMEKASTIYKAYNHAAYDKALIDILNIFQEKVTEFDHFEIYQNESLFYTQKTQYTFIATSTGLLRGKYKYGISACRNNGEETPVTTIEVDRRWWPERYKGINIIMWKAVYNADYYKIYRNNIESSNIYLIASTGYTFYVDIGYNTPNNETEPLIYNFTDMEKPFDLSVQNIYDVNKFFLRLKKMASLIIILFGTDDNTIPEFELNRILELCSKFIPPEVRYKIIFANDSKIVLYPEEHEVDVSENILTEAIYDTSEYDTEVAYA